MTTLLYLAGAIAAYLAIGRMLAAVSRSDFPVSYWVAAWPLLLVFVLEFRAGGEPVRLAPETGAFVPGDRYRSTTSVCVCGSDARVLSKSRRRIRCAACGQSEEQVPHNLLGGGDEWLAAHGYVADLTPTEATDAAV